MNRIVYFLCVSLALTNVSFFPIGFTKFTLFHAMAIIFLGYLTIRRFQGLAANIKISVTLFFLSFYIAISNLFFSSNFKVTSLIYSIIIIIELIILDNISRKLEVEDIKKIIKTVILLFFLSTFFSFLLIVLNITPTGVWSTIFQIYNDGKQIRPMGLSSEPSYAAIILVFSLYVLVRCDNFLFKAKEGPWYALSIITIFLSGSSYGYALLSIFLIFFVIKSNLLSVIFKFLLKSRGIGNVVLAIFALGLIVFLFNSESKPFQRLVNVFFILSETGLNITTGLFKIAYTDSSAGMRIVPTLQLIDHFAASDTVYVLFGMGAGQSAYFYSELWGQLTLVGFIPAFIYNYGIIGTLVSLFCLRFFFPKKGLLLTTMFFLFLFNADFNTQIFVYVLFTSMLAKQIEILNAPQSKLVVL